MPSKIVRRTRGSRSNVNNTILQLFIAFIFDLFTLCYNVLIGNSIDTLSVRLLMPSGKNNRKSFIVFDCFQEHYCYSWAHHSLVIMPHASKRFKIQRESLQKANETRLERLKSKKDERRSVIRGENGAGGSPLVSPPPPDTSPPPAPRPIDITPFLIR